MNSTSVVHQNAGESVAGSTRGKPEGGARVPELDGIRGAAVLMVLAYHGFSWSMERDVWKGFPRLVELVTLPGWMGVDLFFVLSGLLITGILLDAVGKPHYYRNFYGRRALRILPLYYLILVAIYLYYPHSGRFVLFGFIYLSNMTVFFGVPNAYGPLWSLSVEEHFYLAWPAAVAKLGLRGVRLTAIGILVAMPLVRLVSFLHGWDVYYVTWCRLDGLAAGALMATLLKRNPGAKATVSRLALYALAAGIVLGVGGIPFGLWTRARLLGATLMFTDITLLFSGLVGTVVAGTVPALAAVMRFKPLRRCGDLSYCLYIIHLMAFDIWNSLLGQYHPGWWRYWENSGPSACARLLCTWHAFCLRNFPTATSRARF